MRRRHLFIGCMIMLSMVVFSVANAQPSNDAASAKAFVQQFYDWYLPLSTKPVDRKKTVAADVAALKQKPECFDTPLREALLADAAAQAKFPGEIVGLDFDPFLAAQDDVLKVKLGDVKQVGSRYLVMVNNNRLTAEVVNVGPNWKFTNFIYPKSNLMQTLTDLRKEREKWGKK